MKGTKTQKGSAAVFTSIVVALDLEEQGDRSLPFVQRLALAANVPVELLTATSPGMQQGVDLFELERRTKTLGDVDCRFEVRERDDVVEAILEFLEPRPRALLALATHARWLLGQHLVGSVSEDVLARRDRPTLLFGPAAQWRGSGYGEVPSLVIGVHPTSSPEAVLAAAGEWVVTFGGAPIWLVEVVDAAAPGDATCQRAQQRLRDLATDLGARGLEAQARVVASAHPADGLIEFSDRLGDAVIALGSKRWTDAGHSHLGSVARSVAHDGRHPVLVVPVRRGDPTRGGT